MARFSPFRLLGEESRASNPSTSWERIPGPGLCGKDSPFGSTASGISAPAPGYHEILAQRAGNPALGGAIGGAAYATE